MLNTRKVNKNYFLVLNISYRKYSTSSKQEYVPLSIIDHESSFNLLVPSNVQLNPKEVKLIKKENIFERPSNTNHYRRKPLKTIFFQYKAQNPSVVLPTAKQVIEQLIFWVQCGIPTDVIYRRIISIDDQRTFVNKTYLHVIYGQKLPYNIIFPSDDEIKLLGTMPNPYTESKKFLTWFIDYWNLFCKLNLNSEQKDIYLKSNDKKSEFHWEMENLDKVLFTYHTLFRKIDDFKKGHVRDRHNI